MRGRYLFALALGGCADFAGIGDPQPLAPDAPVPPCAFDTIDLCLYASPQNDLVLNDDLVLSTDRDCDLVYNNPIGRSACVLYAKTITINANITPRGARPLILAATDRIEVNGTIDLSAFLLTGFNTVTPASANDRDCVAATIEAAGPGGSFHGKGGDGGANVVGTVSTAAPAISLPAFLRGGCGGSIRSGQGGADQGANISPSGGAIALVAGNSISITSTGKVLANGAGGIGGIDGTTGGGGGGSGGMIKIVATAISILGVVTANGGGGGEGADGTTNGTKGADGTGTAMAAAGGSGHAGGGDGGAGGAGMTVNGAAGANVAGADTDADGGGGGGAGFIAVSGELTGAGTVSPSPTMIQ